MAHCLHGKEETNTLIMNVQRIRAQTFIEVIPLVFDFWYVIKALATDI